MTIEMTLLRSIALFKNSDEETLTKISQHARLRKLKSGTNILTQGDKGETLFVIVSGTVKITLTQSSGDEVFLALLSTGDTFGEMSLIDSNLRSANVLAKEETVLLLLEGACFEHLLSISTAFVKNLLNVLVRRLRMNNARIQALSTLDVNGRVARQLCEFSDMYGTPVDAQTTLIPVRLSQSDIADIVGASRERVNQVMVTYQEREAISVDSHHRITIHDRKWLEARF